ncbi:MAG: DUF3617 domain-containing protein [Sphingomonas sp.]
MKTAAWMIVSLVTLAGCNKSPQVDVHNATGNQVAQAVQQSGVMSGDTMVEPGLWQSKVTVAEMNIPGVPPQYAERMKQSIAEHQQQSSRHCLTKEDVKKPKEGFFAGEDKSCHYAHFTMGGGKMDIQMVCHREGTTQTTNMAGTYTPTSYSMDMSSQGSDGEKGGMTMKMHVDAQRVGECTGKDD